MTRHKKTNKCKKEIKVTYKCNCDITSEGTNWADCKFFKSDATKTCESFGYTGLEEGRCNNKKAIELADKIFEKKEEREKNKCIEEEEAQKEESSFKIEEERVTYIEKEILALLKSMRDMRFSEMLNNAGLVIYEENNEKNHIIRLGLQSTIKTILKMNNEYKKKES